MFCSVLLSADPVVCAWEEGPSDNCSGEQVAECTGITAREQFVVMEVIAKKFNGAPVGMMLKNNQDKLQVRLTLQHTCSSQYNSALWSSIHDNTGAFGSGLHMTHVPVLEESIILCN